MEASCILTQNALNGIVLDELDVGQSDIGPCGLYKGVTLVFLLNHHIVRKTETWQTDQEPSWQEQRTMSVYSSFCQIAQQRCPYLTSYHKTLTNESRYRKIKIKINKS